MQVYPTESKVGKPLRHAGLSYRVQSRKSRYGMQVYPNESKVGKAATVCRFILPRPK